MGSGMSIDLFAHARVDHVRGKGVRVSVRGLSENGGEGLPKGGLIARCQLSKPFEHEGGVDGGENRFEDGRLEQPRTLPVLDLDLPHGQCGWLLTGDRYDEDVRSGTVIGGTADDDGGAAFDG